MTQLKMKSLTGAVALAVLLLAGCGTTTSPQKPANTTSATQTVKKGQVSVIGGQTYSGTANLNHYVSQAKEHSNDATAQFKAAVAYFVNGDYEQSANYYKKAIQLNPKNFQAYNNLGNIYLWVWKQPNAALPYYRTATQLNPSYGFAWVGLIQSEQASGNKSIAANDVKTALAKVPKKDPAYPILKSLSDHMPGR